MRVSGIEPKRAPLFSPTSASFLPSVVHAFMFFSLSNLLPPLSNSFPFLYTAGELDERTAASLWEVLLSNVTDSTHCLVNEYN